MIAAIRNGHQVVRASSARRAALATLLALMNPDERGCQPVVPVEEIRQLGFAQEWEEAVAYVNHHLGFCGTFAEIDEACWRRNVKFRCLCEQSVEEPPQVYRSSLAMA